MPLPLAVQRQKEEAERIEKEMLEGKPASGEGDTPTGEEPGKETPPENQPGNVEPPPQPAPDKSKDPEYWKQKYQTLQGMFEKRVQDETGKIRGELEKQQKTIDALNGIVMNFQLHRETPPSSAKEDGEEGKKPSVAEAPEIDEAKYADWDPEIQELVKSVKVLSTRNKHLEEQLSKVGQSVHTVSQNVAQDSRSRFERELSSEAPTWQAQNHDPDFNDWLDQPAEPVELRQGDTFGSSRRDLLLAAFNRRDASRVAAFFNAYKQPAPSKENPLESQVLPETGGPGKPVDAGGPKYGREDVVKAGQDLVKGRITSEQYEKIINQFDKDFKAGRVK